MYTIISGKRIEGIISKFVVISNKYYVTAMTNVADDKDKEITLRVYVRTFPLFDNVIANTIFNSIRYSYQFKFNTEIAKLNVYCCVSNLH